MSSSLIPVVGLQCILHCKKADFWIDHLWLRSKPKVKTTLSPFTVKGNSSRQNTEICIGIYSRSVVFCVLCFQTKTNFPKAFLLGILIYMTWTSSPTCPSKKFEQQKMSFNYKLYLFKNNFSGWLRPKSQCYYLLKRKL